MAPENNRAMDLTLDQIARRLAERRHRDIQDAERYASVAAILREEGPHGPEVLLIRRSESPRDPWSGHIAMPGGKKEPEDESLEATAIREAEEEVGFDLRKVGRRIGQLDHTPAYARGKRTGMVVAPFVFSVTGPLEVRPSPEVQESLWVPLRRLVTPELRRAKAYDHEGVTLRLPSWEYEGRVIWGLTYFMLDGLLRIAQDDPTGIHPT